MKEHKARNNKCGVASGRSEVSKSFKVPSDISVSQHASAPESCEEMLNFYGTYNIQPTADTENDFPAIAQGTPEYMANRPLEFFRNENDENPASDASGKHCL